MRPIAFAWLRVNHSAPSGPAVIAEGKPPVAGRANSVTSPSAVTRPMRSVFISVNHIAPSGPAVMPNGPAVGCRHGKGLRSRRRAVMRPIRWSWDRVNHSAPSGPGVMTVGPQVGRVQGESVQRAVEGEARDAPLCTKVSHRAPSGPAAMPYGPASAAATGNSVIRRLGSSFKVLLPSRRGCVPPWRRRGDAVRILGDVQIPSDNTSEPIAQLPVCTGYGSDNRSSGYT